MRIVLRRSVIVLHGMRVGDGIEGVIKSRFISQFSTGQAENSIFILCTIVFGESIFIFWLRAYTIAWSSGVLCV